MELMESRGLEVMVLEVTSVNNEVSENASGRWVGEDDSKSNPGAVKGRVGMSYRTKK